MIGFLTYVLFNGFMNSYYYLNLLFYWSYSVKLWISVLRNEDILLKWGFCDCSYGSCNNTSVVSNENPAGLSSLEILSMQCTIIMARYNYLIFIVLS